MLTFYYTLFHIVAKPVNKVVLLEIPACRQAGRTLFGEKRNLGWIQNFEYDVGSDIYLQGSCFISNGIDYIIDFGYH